MGRQGPLPPGEVPMPILAPRQEVTVAYQPLGQLGPCRPHTRTVAEELVPLFNILQTWGYDPRSAARVPPGEHGQGRALDCMVFINQSGGTSAALGERIATYVWQHRVRLGVEYIIWNRQIRNRFVDGGAWRPYTGLKPHTDHVHITFLDTPPAYMPPADPPLPLMTIYLKYFLEAAKLDSDPARKTPSHPIAVKYAQTAFNKVGVAKLDVDGWYGPATTAAVKAWQAKLGKAQTGVMHVEQWYQLAKQSGVFTYPDPSPPPLPVVSLAAVTPRRTPIGHLQRALNKAVAADVHGAWYGATTAAAVKVWQRKLGHRDTGILTLAEWQALAKAAGSFTAKE